MASDNEGRADAVSSEAWKAELKTLLELSDAWLKKADSFEVTRGDSEVEGAYYDCAYALRKRIWAWHEYLWSVDSSDHDGDWVAANILGTLRETGKVLEHCTECGQSSDDCNCPNYSD